MFKEIPPYYANMHNYTNLGKLGYLELLLIRWAIKRKIDLAAIEEELLKRFNRPHIWERDKLQQRDQCKRCSSWKRSPKQEDDNYCLGYVHGGDNA